MRIKNLINNGWLFTKDLCTLETLQNAGCLNGMPRSAQMDMFDLL